MRVWKTFVPVLTVFGLLLAGGCDGAPSPGASASAPTNPAAAGFSGRLIVLASSRSDAVTGLWQLTIGAGRTLVTKKLVDGLTFDAALSPDGRNLAYLQEGGLMVRDLVTGADRKIRSDVSGDPSALCDWSPDGRYLTVTNAGSDIGLIAVGLDGKVTVVDTRKSDWYTPEGASGRDIYYGELGCGSWLDGNRLVFDRLRALPQRIAHPQADHSIPADTTTVAVLNGTTRTLIDSATRWQSLGSCGGRIATVEEAELGTVHILDHPTDQELTRAGGAVPAAASINGAQIKTDISSVGGARVTSRSGDFAFTPGSCQPVTTQADGIHAIDTTTHSIDPKVLVGTDPTHAKYDLNSTYGMWNRRPDSRQFAFLSGSSVQLSDLRTGRLIWVDADETLTTPTPVGWAP